jgi:hypothetical protein
MIISVELKFILLNTLHKMNCPAASSGVSKYQPHKANLAASCGELIPKEIRFINF